jgi:hypothetical protein
METRRQDGSRLAYHCKWLRCMKCLHLEVLIRLEALVVVVLLYAHSHCHGADKTKKGIANSRILFHTTVVRQISFSIFRCDAAVCIDDAFNFETFAFDLLVRC